MVAVSLYLETVPPVVDLHPQAVFYLSQVLVVLAAELGERSHIIGFKRDSGVGSLLWFQVSSFN